MIRVSIDIDARRAGSLFVGGGTVELHAADQERFLEALGEAYSALTGLDCARTLQDARSEATEPVGGEK